MDERKDVTGDSSEKNAPQNQVKEESGGEARTAGSKQRAASPGERIAPGAAPATAVKRSGLATKQKVLLGAAAAVFVGIIGVSALFLVPGNQAQGDTNLLKTTQQPSKESSQTASNDAAADSSASKEANDAEGTDGGAGTVENPARSQNGAYAIQGDVDQAPAGGGGSAQGGNVGGSAQQPEAPQAPAEQTVTVSVSVTSSAVGNPVSGSARPTFKAGATVYDALAATGLSLNAKNDPLGVYILSIGGLAEKEHGGGSGWKYNVNGAYVDMACSARVLQDGDVVEWYYTLG